MSLYRYGAILATGLGLSLILCKPAAAQLIALTNLPTGTPTTGVQLGTNTGAAGSQAWMGVELTNNGPIASLVDVKATFTNNSALPNDNPVVNRVVTGGVYSSVGGSPGVLLSAFNQQTILAGQTDITKTFVPLAPFSLQTGVDYWFVFTADVVTAESALTWRRAVANPAPVPAPNFATTGYKLSTDNKATWGASAQNSSIQIRVAVAPEPASLPLFGVGLSLITMAILRRRLV